MLTRSDDIRPSFSYQSWLRLRTSYVATSQTEDRVSSLKNQIEEKLQLTENARRKQAELQCCKIGVSYLKNRLDEKKCALRTLSAKHLRLRIEADKATKQLAEFKQAINSMSDSISSLEKDNASSCLHLVKTRKLLLLRRCQILEELQSLFAIEPTATINVRPVSSKGKCDCFEPHCVTGVHLPDAGNYNGHDEQQMGIALGFVSQIVYIFSRVVDIALRYSIKLSGSRSLIVDRVPKNASDNVAAKTFPLFKREQDRSMFHYGVYLLNQDIAQLRYCCGISTTDPRATVVNLLSLLQLYRENAQRVFDFKEQLVDTSQEEDRK